MLQAKLQAAGYAVTRSAKHGAGGAEVLELAKEQAGKQFDLVVVFSGSTSSKAAAQQIPALWPAAKVYWYGASPATKILDIQLAKKVFGPKVSGADYWSTSGEAAAREARNIQLPAMLPARVVYVDWRRLQWPGGSYPAQPDGIHVSKQTAEVAFSAPNWPPPPQSRLLLQSAAALLAAGLLVWVAYRKGWL